MKRKLCLFTFFLFCLSVTWVSAKQKSPTLPDSYVIVAGKTLEKDTEWRPVIDALSQKHDNAPVIYYHNSPYETLYRLKQLRPRYVAVVEKPENLNRDYVISFHKLSRTIDDDIFADFLWGIITGYDAAAAMKMVNNSTESLVIKDAVATIMEISGAKWFDRFGWVDDHKRGLWGEKVSAESDTVNRYTDPKNILGKFYELYTKYDPDLVVTAAHATERNLEMPFSLGNLRPKDGKLYADFKDNPQFLKESGKRKVYFAVGNCLIGNIDNTKESMAIAWMNGSNAATMIGYVVTTWYGRNGWGGLKYWLTTPGRYTLAEAIYLNQQDFLNQQYEWSPWFLAAEYPHGEKVSNPMREASRRIQDFTGLEPTMDHIGFMHDRDVLAYYGDPKWDVRLQQIPEENDFTVTTQIKGNQCIVTIKTHKNFNLERMAGDKFKEEHVLDIPFSYFFPERLNHPKLAPGQEWHAVVDENFLLVYDPKFEPNKTYTIRIDIE